MTSLVAGQKCFLVVAGQRQVVTVRKTVYDTDGFDGRGYVVEIDAKPGFGRTVVETQLEPITDFVAGLTGLMADETGRATLREIAERAQRHAAINARCDKLIADSLERDARVSALLGR